MPVHPSGCTLESFNKLDAPQKQAVGQIVEYQNARKQVGGTFIETRDLKAYGVKNFKYFEYCEEQNKKFQAKKKAFDKANPQNKLPADVRKDIMKSEAFEKEHYDNFYDGCKLFACDYELEFLYREYIKKMKKTITDVTALVEDEKVRP